MGDIKPIRLSTHAQTYTARRGFTIEEVEEAIRTAPWEPAEQGRLQCRKNFPYHRLWNGKMYETKQVRPVFVDETHDIVTITVYTYFF